MIFSNVIIIFKKWLWSKLHNVASRNALIKVTSKAEQLALKPFGKVIFTPPVSFGLFGVMVNKSAALLFLKNDLALP